MAIHARRVCEFGRSRLIPISQLPYDGYRGGARVDCLRTYCCSEHAATRKHRRKKCIHKKKDAKSKKTLSGTWSVYAAAPSSIGIVSPNRLLPPYTRKQCPKITDRPEYHNAYPSERT
ncbi:unnamed protein product [Ectocarpus sp. 6 AP-2014]